MSTYNENSAWLSYFLELCKIPHGSGHTKAVADYLEGFAKSQRLLYTRDAADNIFMVRGASPGREAEGAVLLQGHTDMVCEKDAASAHNFLTDPIKPIIENGFLRADGTTLGGDDGVAVAIMLALLTDRGLSAPRLECLFTSDEEIGLVGAKAFDKSQITARRLINLDSEEEGVATIGCAGGAVSTLSFDGETLPAAGKAIHVRIFGLAGGHSGAEIHKPRQNAIVLMARLLSHLYDNTPFRLAALAGGTQNNAIPRECDAVILVQDFAYAVEVLQDFGKTLAAECDVADRGMRLHITREKRDVPSALTFRSTSRALSAILLTQNGVLAMCKNAPDEVETSTNIGIARVTGDKISVVSCDRSCVASRLADVLARHRRLAHLLDAKLDVDGEYPAWEPKQDTPLQRKYLAAAEKLFGKPARVATIHAGLECGILSDGIPDMDAISIGPELYDIHTPTEQLSLASFDRLYALVVALLAKEDEIR